jgi:hypothetical protein
VIYAVWIGGKPRETGPPTAAVDVYTQQVASDGCGVVQPHVGTFLNQSASGPFTLKDVSGSVLVLSAADGQTYYFDLVARRYY